MEIILTEKIDKLGDIGDLVSVKNGFARNFLIPAHKALRATAENREYFEKQKAEFLQRNEKVKQEAKKIYDKLNNKSVIITNNASDEGRLYGSVMPKDIADKVTIELKVEVKKSQIILDKPIREIGIIKTKVRIHADYVAEVTVNIARSLAEAKEQLKNLNKAKKDQQADDEDNAQSKPKLDKSLKVDVNTASKKQEIEVSQE